MSALEHLRRLRLEGDTPSQVFYQLKSLFHTGKPWFGPYKRQPHYFGRLHRKQGGGKAQDTDQLREVANIEKAMEYIEQIMKPGVALTEQMIRELHAMTVDDLLREGDKTPGAYRNGAVRISQSEHLPPDFIQVQACMQDLVEFVNREDSPKYDFMKVALAHHRFGWIHPIGNVRVVRLLTYALLMKYGFNVNKGGRVLNPTAVFSNNRERYYAMLSMADKGTKEGNVSDQETRRSGNAPSA